MNNFSFIVSLFLSLLLSLNAQSNLFLKNDHLVVQIDSALPRLISTTYMPTSSVYGGYVSKCSPLVSVNNEDVVVSDPSNFRTNWTEVNNNKHAQFRLVLQGTSVSFQSTVSILIHGAISIDRASVSWSINTCNATFQSGKLSGGDYQVQSIFFARGFDFIQNGVGDGYFRDLFTGQVDYVYQIPGAGEYWPSIDTGILSSCDIPELTPIPGVIVGGYKADGKTGFFLNSTRRALPFLTKMSSHKYPDRVGAFTVSPNTITINLKCGPAPRYETRINFFQDLNGDDVVNDVDVQLAVRQQSPDMPDIYKGVVYKINMQNTLPYGNAPIITFKQALNYVKMMSDITDNLPQVVYLVGWQFTGHDTGYPSLNKINANLGTISDLQNLINASKTLYNAQISYHINFDDAFARIYGQPNPEFTPEIIATDIDGSMFIWANYTFTDPTQPPTYHISKTKDIMSGRFFSRFDEFMKLVNPSQTVHIDAWRCINYSWEKDGTFIGLDDETICGCQPQFEYLRKYGLSPGIEGANGSPLFFPGLIDYVWHGDSRWMFMWFKKIAQGGNLGNDIATILGTSIDNDYYGGLNTTAQWNLMADDVYLKTQLYLLYLTDDWINLSINGSNYITSKFRNGAEVTGIPNQYLNVMWPVKGSDGKGDLIKVATRSRRFLPRTENTIYVYLNSSVPAESQSWMIPLSWVGANITSDTFTPNGILRNTPNFIINGRIITLTVQPGLPIRLTKK